MLMLCCVLPQISLVWAENTDAQDGAHVHIQDGVVYCDVQTFTQEPYILKVIGSGSPMTVVWQFDVVQARDYWLDKTVVSVRLGRQVIPDLVTQRWLMRDLSGGVVKYTDDAHEAMRFLTSMEHIAVVDVSVLDAQQSYMLTTTSYIHEGEEEEEGWWSSLTDWGEDMGTVALELSEQKEDE